VLPREELSAHTARSQVAAMCWELDKRLDVGEIIQVVGEMVNNAILHAAPTPGIPDTITLAIIVTERDLRVEVGDLDPHLPTRQQAAPDAEHGRGMTLVAALSDRYGTSPFKGGKVTWAEWDHT
jgi:serine/threonine-protein kinase RsbW